MDRENYGKAKGTWCLTKSRLLPIHRGKSMAQNLRNEIGSKRDLVNNQVPFTTKPELLHKYDTLMKLLAVTKCKEE